MVVVEPKRAKHILNLLYNYTTEERTSQELSAINNMLEFFRDAKKETHLEFIRGYFEESYKFEKDYTRSGQMYMVCMHGIGYDPSHGYKIREDIVNRMEIELIKLGY